MQLQTNSKVIPVERDGERVGEIRLDLSDTGLARRFLELMDGFESRQADMLRRAGEIDNLPDGPDKERRGLAFVGELVQWAKGQIDQLLGAGTSQMVFGGSESLALCNQFLLELAKELGEARAQKVARYLQ